MLATFSASILEYFQVQLTKKVAEQNTKDIVIVLWAREKYWDEHLFTLSHILNNLNEWYAPNKRGYRN